MNQVQISGFLGQEVRTGVGKSGKNYAFLSLGYSYGKEPARRTSWFDVAAFGDAVEQVRSLNKGDLVVVEGYLSENRYTDKEGKEQRRVQIVAQNVSLLRDDEPAQGEIGV